MSEPDPKPARGMGSIAGEQFSFIDAVGGVRGMVESVLPSLVFLIVFAATSELRTSLYAALGAAGVLVLARLVVRGPVTQAISGLVGVALCAFVANRTGDARDYYVVGFWQNLGYLALYGLSLVPLPALRVGGHPQPRGAYPLIGLLVGFLMQEGLRWRAVPARARGYWLATWCWVAMFALRLVVQVPLYYANNVAALGISRIAMGIPLFALTAWVSWLLIRPTNHTVPAA